ncbi:MAG TPA: hypothetical protein VN644_18750 [Pyrinomonadaceae bacterium]|nr:hypothetical protein [Pyrinomonadaceae bacterium]
MSTFTWDHRSNVVCAIVVYAIAVKADRNLSRRSRHPTHGQLFRALPLAKAFESC